jgi:hypothetical protein
VKAVDVVVPSLELLLNEEEQWMNVLEERLRVLQKQRILAQFEKKLVDDLVTWPMECYCRMCRLRGGGVAAETSGVR